MKKIITFIIMFCLFIVPVSAIELDWENDGIKNKIENFGQIYLMFEKDKLVNGKTAQEYVDEIGYIKISDTNINITKIDNNESIDLNIGNNVIVKLDHFKILSDGIYVSIPRLMFANTTEDLNDNSHYITFDIKDNSNTLNFKINNRTASNPSDITQMEIDSFNPITQSFNFKQNTIEYFTKGIWKALDYDDNDNRGQLVEFKIKTDSLFNNKTTFLLTCEFDDFDAPILNTRKYYIFVNDKIDYLPDDTVVVPFELPTSKKINFKLYISTTDSKVDTNNVYVITPFTFFEVKNGNTILGNKTTIGLYLNEEKHLSINTSILEKVVINNKNENIVYMDETGLIKALKPGSAEIVLSLANVEKTLIINVANNDNPETGDTTTIVILSTLFITSISVIIYIKKNKYA